jgi:hypothetical protein
MQVIKIIMEIIANTDKPFCLTILLLEYISNILPIFLTTIRLLSCLFTSDGIRSIVKCKYGYLLFHSFIFGLNKLSVCKFMSSIIKYQFAFNL